MSDGIKAWHEEMEELAEKEAAAKFAKLESRFVRAKISGAIASLERLNNDSIALTRNQWYLLTNALALLQELQ